ncbi:TetR/AcrR family transcriptional regulator [Rhodococcus sp. OK302]|uniref:TetR/AcrR family transcriptional regulator n=1 Tax=Rhodococcus sp. OK302 TaxID=1882769 RepID=UPI000B941175|nr:TetR/AcrR family transcriptional regulator [Rhodococcus sp. OK302]OYD67037.1 TetR family transcriptional regulator [Rhodococcus sp. OK302]
MTAAEAEKKRRPKDRRQQILLNARSQFAQLGYHNVTMASIAEAVDISPGALYRHFSNKSVLLEAAVASSFDDVAPVRTSSESIAEMLAVNCMIAVRFRETGLLWSREARNLPPEAHKALRERLRESNDIYAGLILAARPDLSAADAEILAWAILSILSSPGHHSVELPTTEFANVLAASGLEVVRADIRTTGLTVETLPSSLEPASQRERLLSSAIALFGLKGYQATGMNDIGAAAGVSGPSLYSYFDSKSDLLNAAIERGTHALWIALHTALRHNTTHDDALMDVVRSYVLMTEENVNLTSLLFAEPALLAPDAQRSQREYVAEWVALLRGARPQLAEGTARVLVHAALGVIHDLMRTPHLAATERFSSKVIIVASAVLRSGD